MEWPLLNRSDRDCTHLWENNRFLNIDNHFLKRKREWNKTHEFIIMSLRFIFRKKRAKILQNQTKLFTYQFPQFLARKISTQSYTKVLAKASIILASSHGPTNSLKKSVKMWLQNRRLIKIDRPWHGTAVFVCGIF